MLNPRLVHWHGQCQDALVPWHIGNGVGKHDAQLSGVRVAGPNLVSVNDVVVATVDHSGSQQCQVGAGCAPVQRSRQQSNRALTTTVASTLSHVSSNAAPMIPARKK